MATLCVHGKKPSSCRKCVKAANKAAAKVQKKANKAQAKASRKASRAAAKRDKKSTKVTARRDNKKVNQIRNAARDMKTPWHSDGTSRSGIHDAQGRSRAGIRYDRHGKRIWDD